MDAIELEADELDSAGDEDAESEEESELDAVELEVDEDCDDVDEEAESEEESELDVVKLEADGDGDGDEEAESESEAELVAVKLEVDELDSDALPITKASHFWPLLKYVVPLAAGQVRAVVEGDADETILEDVVEDIVGLVDPLALPLEPRRELKMPVNTLLTPVTKKYDVPDAARLKRTVLLPVELDANVELEKRLSAVELVELDGIIELEGELVATKELVELEANVELKGELVAVEPEEELVATEELLVVVELIGETELEATKEFEVVGDEEPPTPPRLMLVIDRLGKLNDRPETAAELDITELLEETELMIETEIESTLDVVVAETALDADVVIRLVMDGARDELELELDEESSVAELVTAGELVVNAVDDDVATGDEDGATVRTASQTVGL
ncbi:hypothetical protein BU16DRAFT_555496 [Lophium mytilinum]|uniref:Uncharacterized protein n=1 Tax=Lophium mytilinum TaxID=390894 RepID=A0A6A6R8P3_9PEZI|nr:hypothetical protein BU16DRAFT_555496 [Lophium mytilinum]